MRVIVTSLGTPRSAGENFGTTWVRWQQAWERTRQVSEHFGVPATILGAPRIAVERSGKNNISFPKAAGAHGNHSYYLSFNNF